jgi:cell division septum initiation protein DivIVA
MARRRAGTLDDQLQQTLEHNEQLQQTIDGIQQRLYELEERVDFTERMLATQRDADRLDAPRRDV